MLATFATRRPSLTLLEPMGHGNFGFVRSATWTKGDTAIPAIAKSASAAPGEDAGLALEYLAVEREVNEAIQGAAVASSPGFDASHFCRYLGSAAVDGDDWLVWEQLPGCDVQGRVPSLHDYAGRAPALTADYSLSLLDVIRSLLGSAKAIHSLGFCHRDMKLENVLIAKDEVEGASLRLIDMGSAALVDGCSAFDALLQRCTGYDPARSPCSPLYAPPEEFVDLEHPQAFDVFAIGMCYLRLALRALRTDEQCARFRSELAACGGELDAWVRLRLSETVVDATLQADLAAAFPSSRDGSSRFALVRAMLRTSPAQRPTIDSLLVHPALTVGTAGAASAATEAASAAANAADEVPNWLVELLEAAEDGACQLAFYDVVERPLAVSVRLAPPLGLMLEEQTSAQGELPSAQGGDGAPSNGGASGEGDSSPGGGGSPGGEGTPAGLVVSGILEGSAAEAEGSVLVGDRLVAIDSVSMRDASLEEAMARVRAARRTLELRFERACTPEGCDVRGTDLDVEPRGMAGQPATDQQRDEPMGRAAVEEARGRAAMPTAAVSASTGAARVVRDVGAADTYGARVHQEDRHVITSFVVTPRESDRAAEGAATSAAEGAATSAAEEDTPEDAAATGLASGGDSSQSYVLTAVMDGHRGSAASAFAAAALPAAVRQAIERGEPSPLSAGWRQVCAEYAATGEQSGSCVSAALLADDGRCEMLNCGDCRVVLASEVGGATVVEFASRDHAASDPLEATRIRALGGDVVCAANGEMRVRVDGEYGLWNVAIARSLGGSEWRGGGISDAAEGATVRRAPRHRFLVLATDGVWGALDDAAAETAVERSQTVVLQAAAALEAGTSAGDVADGLVRCAGRSGGTDNASCIVVLL